MNTTSMIVLALEGTDEAAARRAPGLKRHLHWGQPTRAPCAEAAAPEVDGAPGL